MVISTNKDPLRSEFECLLTKMVDGLIQDSMNSPNKYLKYSSFDIEKVTYNLLSNCAEGTPFENTIELIGGQHFPDIVANNYYGVEVKTTKSNHWKSIGSSVAEGTRVQGVERIFMLFGKLATPIDFRCKPYEDCLSEVVVTHSPRYQIDMNLKKGESFFDKIKIPYDKLRKQENPIKTVLDYYRKKLKPGETTWWADTGESKTSNILIRLWSSLSIQERDKIKIMSYCLFPEILGSSMSKFNRMNLWLATVQGVVVPNVRDLFTAGGRDEILFRNIKYNIPRIMKNLCSNLSVIKECVESMDTEELAEYWGIKVDIAEIFHIWSDLVCEYAKGITNFPLKEYIEEECSSNIH